METQIMAAQHKPRAEFATSQPDIGIVPPDIRVAPRASLAHVGVVGAASLSFAQTNNCSQRCWFPAYMVMAPTR